MTQCNSMNSILGLAVLAILIFAGFQLSKSSAKENFTYDQIALNAKNYTFIPSQDCKGCLPKARPDMSSLTCSSNNLPKELRGMTPDQIKREVDLHYRKPMEMVPVKDLLPETDISGLNYGTDPAEDFANKFVWHRTTHARLKRRNWETGAAMIRGDLIIEPGHHSWFNSTLGLSDITPSFISKQYACPLIDVEDLSYNMHKIH
jgi:hypothetical protein